MIANRNPLQICLLAAALAFSTPIKAQVTFADSPQALGANDSIDWGHTGPAGHQFGSYFGVGSSLALGATVVSSGGLERLDEGNWWFGGFPAGSALIYNDGGYYNGGADDIYIYFTTPVSGGGAQIQALSYTENGSINLGRFSYAILAYDSNGNLLGRFGGTSSEAPVFVGLTSTSANISEIIFDAFDDTSGNGRTFAIGALSINDTNDAPTITSQPQSVTVNIYTNTSLTVSASYPNIVPVTYQWLFNGLPLTGATNSTLTISNTTYFNQGTYQVNIANTFGTVKSSLVTLTLAPLTPNALGIAMVNQLPILIWPVSATNFVLQMTTNLASDNWVTVTNGTPCFGLQVTNTPVVDAFQWQDSVAGGRAVFSVAASFTAANGYDTIAGLALGKDGNFYGETYVGPGSADGAVFQMTPAGTLTTLAPFTGADGAYPYAALTLGNDGNFYGVTVEGGDANLGTVFQVTTNGTLTTILSFSSNVGEYPSGRLVLGNDGNFYGTTPGGGSSGNGTVFQLTIYGPLNNWALRPLANFEGTNGQDPAAGLTLGNDGSFYGTTVYGGSNNDGTIFRITTNGTLTTVYSFNGSDGQNPSTELTLGPDGSFYGTTSFSGFSGNGNGTIFRVTTNGALTTLVSFNGTDGAIPQNRLILGSDGNFYGETVSGGTYNDGTLFQMITNGMMTTLINFDGAKTGANPHGGLTPVSGSSFYGTTGLGGASGYGTIFRLAIPPSLGIATIATVPIAVYPASGTNFVLQASTTIASGNWVTVTNGIPYIGVMITNAPGTAFFRLH